MQDLKKLRTKIDKIDDRIIHLLAERVRVCEAIGSTKKAAGLPVKNSERETQVRNQVREKAKNLCLDPAAVEAVYREIVNMCSSVQE